MAGIANWKTSLAKFNDDEDGMAIVESVMVLAIAAALAIGLYYLFQKATIGQSNSGIFGLLGNMVDVIFGKVTSFVTEALGF